ELGCDWSKVRVEHAPAAPTYFHTAFGMQMTGGSTTTWSEFERYRTVGAMARQMLVQAASKEWKVRPAQIRVEDGHLISGWQRAPCGRWPERPRALPPPKNVSLKPPERWNHVGKPHRRLDSPEKITGKANFGIDTYFPGLRTAFVSRAPVFGAKLRSFDAKAA